MTKIKICGLRRDEDIEYVNKWKPDYVGFVFARSKRQVTAKQAARLKARLLPELIAVGVFVNEAPQIIAELVAEHIIDMVQLHGEESAAEIMALKELVSCPVVKAIRVKDRETVKQALSLPADYLLFDTYIKGMYGGSGASFDRTLLKDITKEKPFFLAGGLNADNVTEAIADCLPYGVDLSSGVEVNGYKEEGKIERIIRIVRERDEQLLIQATINSSNQQFEQLTIRATSNCRK